MYRLSPFLYGIPLLFACNSSTVPSGRVQVPIDRASFQAPAQVHFSVRNETAQTIFVSRCGERVSLAIERHRMGAWENAGAAICPANLLMAPAELRSGEALSDSVRVADPGEYRLVVNYGSGVLRVLYGAFSSSFVIQ